MSTLSSSVNHYDDYEIVIGIEVHVQLNTQSKIFCACPNGPAQTPNTNICPICTGQPGVLPVLNAQVVQSAIMAGLATNCHINTLSYFARKHYFYPDLPKNFQTTQSDLPICIDGHVSIPLEDGSIKNIRLIRIHIEEDAGKNIHSSYSNESFVDLNRTGTPLLEIVTHPDIRSIYEAQAYLKTLHAIVVHLGICSGNMEEGAFRADTNISVRKKGDPKLGTRCELKNINSFKFIGDAIKYEVKRQIDLLEDGKKITQETRLWDTKERKTLAMRSKEEAADYRYFNEPDLPPLLIDAQWIESVKKQLPELPAQKLERLTQKGLTPYEAEILINDTELAQYYEQAAQNTQSKALINWILRDLIGLLKEKNISLTSTKITPQKLAALVELIETGALNNRAAQEILALIEQTGQEPQAIMHERGLQQIGSSDEIEAIIKEIIITNPTQVTAYKAGTTKLWGFFVGQAMAKTKGKGNPQMINDLLKKYLE